MATQLAHDAVRMVAADHVFCELGGEAVILQLDSGMYYGLDPVGTHAWRLLQEPRSLGELRDLMSAEFDVTPDRCEADLRVFLRSLRDHGLLDSRGPADE